MKLTDIFNDNSVCIFTDSSFKNMSNDKNIAVGITAPSICIYIGTDIVYQDFYILHNSTTQQGELYAILMGVMKSYLYKDYKNIDLKIGRWDNIRKRELILGLPLDDGDNEYPLKKMKYDTKIISIPRKVSSGCGMALRLKISDRNNILKILQDNNINYVKLLNMEEL